MVVTSSCRLLVILLGTLAVSVGVATAGAPLPLWQRVLLGGEYPGFAPQPTPPVQLSLAAFVRATRGSFVRITPATLTQELRRDGFRGAVIEELSGPQKRSAVSAAVRLGSLGLADRSLNFFYNDDLQPCPNTCTVSAFEFPVPGIPGAKGSRRVRFRAESKQERPFEQDTVYFTSGPVAYAVISRGKPNGVDRGKLIVAARNLYTRVKGSPLVG